MKRLKHYFIYYQPCLLVTVTVTVTYDWFMDTDTHTGFFKKAKSVLKHN